MTPYVFEGEKGECLDEEFDQRFVKRKIVYVDVDGRPENPVITIYVDGGLYVELTLKNREDSMMIGTYSDSGKDATEGPATPPSAVRESND